MWSGFFQMGTAALECLVEMTPCHTAQRAGSGRENGSKYDANASTFDDGFIVCAVIAEAALKLAWKVCTLVVRAVACV